MLAAMTPPAALDPVDHRPLPEGRGPRSDALALLLLLPAPSVGVLAAMVLWPGSVGTTVFALAKAWMLLLPLVWWRLVDRQRWSASPARHGGFGVGAVLGVAISIVIVAGYLLIGRDLIDAGHVRAEAVKNGIGTPLTYGLATLYWIGVNSVLEEYVYRWFIFRKFESWLSTWGAVIASALAFVVHHVIALKVQFGWDVTLIASAGIFIGGAIWSWMYGRYRSVWPGYLSHAIVDVAVFGVGAWIIFGG